MLRPGELARYLRASAARTRPQLVASTKRVVDAVAKDARDMIGHENANWPKLAQSTIAEKERLGYTGRLSATDPLLREGTLLKSIGAQAEATGSGARGVVGSTDKVAAYQEMGTSRMPPRPFLSTSMGRVQAKAERAFGEQAVLQLTPGVR